ncbi:hypothetical protein VTP01DRAFT_10948 [Rhizomucor pusillus]|uniref:uncharacterized protein n=1 Tax=Rhizomucor pusillus TaxID=4840 RepID=UPI003743FF78
MQSTSIGVKLSRFDTTASSGSRRLARTAMPGRPRRFKFARPILTIDQMQEIGRSIGCKNLRQSVEFFSEPSNLFTLSKAKLSTVHELLFKYGLTTKKVPAHHPKQNDRARFLYNIIYPGQPLWRTRNQALRQLRESRKPELLAYDLVPSSDFFEIDQEVVHISIDEHLQEEDDDCTLRISLPTRNFMKTKRQEGQRYFMYLWQTRRVLWVPQVEFLTTATAVKSVDDKNQWTEPDQRLIDGGFRHIDLTEKIDWDTALADKTIDIYLRRAPGTNNIKDVSVCTAWQKHPSELVSQLYVQSSSICIANAIDATKTKASNLQSKIARLLDECPLNDRDDIEKTQQMFHACTDAFPNSARHLSGGSAATDGTDEDEDIVLGDQVVPLTDPITLARVEHPARGIYCSHIPCFDAKIFFECNFARRNWQCPICSVNIKGIHELYIDRDMAKALAAFPKETRLIMRDGNFTSGQED